MRQSDPVDLVEDVAGSKRESPTAPFEGDEDGQIAEAPRQPALQISDLRIRQNQQCEIKYISEPPGEQSSTVGLARLAASPTSVATRREGLAKVLGSRIVSLVEEVGSTGAPVPNWFIDELGDAARVRVGALVFDCVLDARVEGRWVSGPTAAAYLLRDHSPRSAGDLSTRAIVYAFAMRIGAPRGVAHFLYRFGRLPMSPRWLRSVSCAATTDSLIPWFEREGLARVGTATWSKGPQANGAWWLWRRRIQPHARNVGLWKLYIDVMPEAIPVAVRACLETLTDSDATAFKLASTAGDALRPDKIVVYYPDRESMESAAKELASDLHGFATQGLPFAPRVRGCPNILWGIDPPGATGLPWAEERSWRHWACSRLGFAIVRTGAADDNVRLSQVGQRLNADGVDVSTWAPMDSLIGEWTQNG